MKANLSAILAAVLLAVLPASAQETYLYTNEFLAPGLSYVNNAEGFAFGFRTDSFSYGPIELQIWAMNISAGTYSLGLYSDGGGQPGTLLFSYSGIPGGAPIGNPAIISFLPDGPMSLEPDTTYYTILSCRKPLHRVCWFQRPRRTTVIRPPRDTTGAIRDLHFSRMAETGSP